MLNMVKEQQVETQPKSVGTASGFRRARLVMPNDEAEYRENPICLSLVTRTVLVQRSTKLGLVEKQNKLTWSLFGLEQPDGTHSFSILGLIYLLLEQFLLTLGYHDRNALKLPEDGRRRQILAKRTPGLEL